MIGQSQSGTGKTAAFVLTMLSRVDFTKNKTQVSVHLFTLSSGASLGEKEGVMIATSCVQPAGMTFSNDTLRDNTSLLECKMELCSAGALLPRCRDRGSNFLSTRACLLYVPRLHGFCVGREGSH